MSKTNYKERLILPEEPPEDEVIFYTKCQFEVARHYERVVIGERGPYVEFYGEMLTKDGIFIPENEKWRITNENCYYVEWRTKDKSYTKIYNQKKVVDYADYKIGRWYISVFDLTSNLYPELIKPKK